MPMAPNTHTRHISVLCLSAMGHHTKIGRQKKKKILEPTQSEQKPFYSHVRIEEIILYVVD